METRNSGRRTVISNATVAADYGVFNGHLLIEGTQIAALVRATDPVPHADELIDGSGCVVLPGAIDMHTHFEDPGHTEREDFTTGTMAAAAGGVTTVFEHPLTYPAVTTTELYVSKREMASRKAVIDFGLWGALTGSSLPHMAGQRHEGAIGFKAFMSDAGPDYDCVDDAELLAGLEQAAALDALVLVHAENDAILRARIGGLRAAGRRDLRAHLEARPALAEEEAAHRALYLARRCGARLQIVHTSSPVTINLVTAARSAGQVATAEVCGHHLLLDADDFLRIGPSACCAPPLRDRSLVEQMWDRVLAGEIDSLVSDHGAYTVEEKRRGLEDIFESPLGCQDVQETVPATFSEAYHNRGMTLDAFVRFSSTNAARTAGLYPRKGTIRPGSQADLAIWDLATEWTVDAAAQQFSKNPWSPYDGRRLRARVLRR
ncbi:MAG: amidohydrolase family protein, partial [Solirubrobacteraceae bacterium]